MNERGNSCYANAFFQVLLRSKMSVSVLAEMRASMQLYVNRLEKWWNDHAASHAAIWQIATTIRVGAGVLWENFQDDLFVLFVTDMFAHGLLPDATDANFEKADLSSVHRDCRSVFCVFAAEYAMCNLQRQMQEVRSGRNVDFFGFGVSLTQVLDLLYLASSQTATHRTLFGGANQHDAGELMSFALEALSIGTSRTIFNGTKTETVKTRYCLDEAHGDDIPTTRREKDSCYVTVNLGVAGDNTPRTIEFYLKDGQELFEEPNEVHCDKCHKKTVQSELSHTTYDEFASFYTVEARNLEATGPDALANSNIYHMSIPEFISLPQTRKPGTTREYELIAVIQHRAAHYVAYVKDRNEWILYNDVDVSKSSLHDATASNQRDRWSPHLIFYKRLPAHLEAAAGAVDAAAGAARAAAGGAAEERVAAAAARGVLSKDGDAGMLARATDRLRSHAAASLDARAPPANARPAPAAGVDKYLDIKKRKVPDLTGVGNVFGTWEDRTAIMFPWVKKHAALLTYWNSLDDASRKIFWLTMQNIITEVQKKATVPDKQKAGDVTITFLQSSDIVTLMAHAFFGIFDVDGDQKHKDGSSIQSGGIFSMTNLFHGHSKYHILWPHEKIKCIFGYFDASLCQGPTIPRRVTFHRCRTKDKFLANMLATKNNKATMRYTTVIEHKHIDASCDFLQGLCWEVDFANKRVGGGVIGRGCLQEEIRFLECPELIVCKLFMEELRDDESVRIENYRQFNVTKGYGETFEWVSIKESEEPMNSRRMIVMDALPYDPACDGFMLHNIQREIQKAYVGFNTPTDKNPICTGHWGCGSFNGDPQLKAVIQMLAAGMAGKRLFYCVMGIKSKEIQSLANAVRGKGVFDVYTLLINMITQVNPLQNFAHAHVIDKLFVDFCTQCAALKVEYPI